MITIRIEEDKLLSMLKSRVESWTKDPVEQQLFSDMYESYVYGGVFDDAEFSPAMIVDNDYVNYCDVIRKGDDCYDEILAFYKENGLGDCSREIDDISYIEAECKGVFLIRVNNNENIL